MRFGAVRQENIVDDRVQIIRVLTEIIHMTLASIHQELVRAALATPVKCKNGEAPAAEISYDLKILFNELGPALNDADGSGASTCGLPPSRIADRNTC